MELKLVRVLLLAFTLSAAAGTTTVGSNATTSTTVGPSATNSTSVGSSATNSTSVGPSATNSTSVGPSATNSTSVGSSATNPTSVGPSATNSTSVGSSATNSTSVGSSATNPPSVGPSPATSATVGSSATNSTTVGSSATTSTSVGSSATTSTSVGSSATTIKTGGMRATTIKTGNSKSAERPTTAPLKKQPNFKTARFKIALTVQVNASFSDLLQNASSELYKNHSSEFKEKMMPVYENIPGFLYVEVTGFSEGSIIVHHKVIIKPDAENGKEDLYRIIQTKMNILTIFNRPVELNDTGFKSLLDTIKDNCKAGGICLKGFTCKNGKYTSSTTCQSPCTPVDCHRGTCYVNTDGKPTCKCNSSDDVVYGGDKCDVQGTRMSMGTGDIAGIAGGVGGGAILLLSIALGCMCCSRRKGKNPEKDMANEDEVALSERMERDIYSHRQPGQFNYGADIKDEYRYTGRKDEGRGYEEWLMHKERSEHESSGRRGENDFRAPNYSGNWGRSHGDDRRGDNANMEPAMFGRGVRTSGLGTSQYSSPEDVPPDYDQDDKRQIIPHPRDQSRENPYTRMPGDQPPSRPQSSLLSNSYSQGGNVYEHIDTDEPYALRRPNYR